MIKFNFRLSVKNNLGLFWFRFTLHWNWFELSVCHLVDQSDSKLKPTEGKEEGAGGGGGVKTMGLNVWVGGLMRDTP